MEAIFHGHFRNDLIDRLKPVLVKPGIIKIKLVQKIVLYCLLCGFITNVSALTLSEAERIALQTDPLIESHKATARAWRDDAVADNQLPDPKLRFGMYNLPLDTFDASQEPTTQFRLGVQQAFPRGDSLDLKQIKSEWNAAAETARAEVAQRILVRDVRETFLDLYYQVEAGRIIKASRELFSQLVEITEAHYASGKANQQDVLRAELELSRLDDRSIKIQSKEDESRARLAQWLNERAWQEIDLSFPHLPEFSDNTETNEDVVSIIALHPAIRAETAKVEARKQDVSIAQQQYKPGWGVGIEYRKRFGENPDGSEREDMMAAMVTMDIPLFTENRQDKRVVANEEKTNAVRFARDDKLRTLKQVYDSNRAKLIRLDQRHYKYKSDLLKSARSNAEAALKAYRSGVTEFTNLMRAHITELDVKLSDLRIRVDRAIAKTQLIYVVGEQS